jgi:hypothetical protein
MSDSSALLLIGAGLSGIRLLMYVKERNGMPGKRTM